VRVTIKDIANEAGVSITTVSRVLNNREDVNEKTREKVLKIIEKYNYNPNSVARSLVMNKTYTIGLIVPDISNPFFAEIARAVDDELRGYGYSVLVCNTDNKKQREKESIDLLRSKQVDSIIGSFSYDIYEEIFKLEREGIPVVQIDRFVKDSKAPAIIVDNTSSAYLATEYLIKKGHKKIVHIAGDLNTNTGYCRAEGYRMALEDNNIDFNEELFLQGDFGLRSAYLALKELLEKEASFTAVFASNDLMAIGAYEALREYGLKIPEDVSVFGHDNSLLSSLVKPGLSTMHQPIYKLGKKAARVVIDILKDNKYPEPRRIIIKTSLVERASVKAIN
jgi:LacI family transcriptional regulator